MFKLARKNILKNFLKDAQETKGNCEESQENDVWTK